MASSSVQNKLIKLAESTTFGDNFGDDTLETFESRFDELADQEDVSYKELILDLAELKDQKFYEETGWQLLKWLITYSSKLFEDVVASGRYGDNQYPIHTAIMRQNIFFLDALVEVSDEPGCSISDILSSKCDNKRTCVYAAINQSLPCASEMVKKCSIDTIKARDKDGWTPLHVVAKLQQRGWEPKLLLQKRPKTVGQARTPSNISRPRGLENSDPLTDLKRENVLNRDQRGNQGRSFDPHHVYKEIKAKSARMQLEEQREYMKSLLTAVNNSGMSPYQIKLQSLRKAVQGDAKVREERFREEMKSDIFQFLGEDIPSVKRALYGTEGMEKELYLDMSDFNNPAHDFKGYIAQLTEDMAQPINPGNRKNSTSIGSGDKQVQIVRQFTLTESNAIEFEDILFYVCLPDFNNFKELPHSEVRTLFEWLQYQGVTTIRSLDIPDNTTQPMSDILLKGAVLDKFEVNKLMWRKLDINLDILIRSENADKITDLTLYSSGNWSVLYHWMSEEGLMKLPALRNVIIKIVQLHPENDEKSHAFHQKLCGIYKGKLDGSLKRMKDARRDFNGVVSTDEPWNFPANRYDQKNEPFVPNLKLYEHLNHCHGFLKGLENLKMTDIDGDQRALFREIKKRFLRFTSQPSHLDPNEGSDQRIKVAVIDNGADRIRYSVRKRIAKGESFVTAGAENGDRKLPWWMVADPHGTQMASLIEKANPFVRLYIARVGKGRGDILPGNAADAVDWAIEQKVDVISISWVIKQDHPKLRRAIEKAVANNDPDRRPILVFCSTADEGIYSGPVYPAKYPHTVSVAATDMYGHLQPTSAGGVNILVPGDNVSADGPSYMERYTSGTVSGSSVATASAAGIASLALLLLKTFNQKDDKAIRDFYTKEGIMRVFNKMQSSSDLTGIQLSGLFPGDSDGQNEMLHRGKMLRSAWQISEFPEVERNNSGQQ